jgi:hypothetical protein
MGKEPRTRVDGDDEFMGQKLMLMVIWVKEPRGWCQWNIEGLVPMFCCE